MGADAEKRVTWEYYRWIFRYQLESFWRLIILRCCNYRWFYIITEHLYVKLSMARIFSFSLGNLGYSKNLDHKQVGKNAIFSFICYSFLLPSEKWLCLPSFNSVLLCRLKKDLQLVSFHYLINILKLNQFENWEIW